MNWENWPTKISYIMLRIEKTAIRFLPNSGIRFCDQHLLTDFMILFRPIWHKVLYP